MEGASLDAANAAKGEGFVVEAAEAAAAEEDGLSFPDAEEGADTDANGDGLDDAPTLAKGDGFGWSAPAVPVLAKGDGLLAVASTDLASCPDGDVVPVPKMVLELSPAACFFDSADALRLIIMGSSVSRRSAVVLLVAGDS